MIDDDALVRRSVRRVVSAMGLEVLEASDGEAGLAILAAQHIDVALVDMRMPGISGLEVLARARAMALDTECIVVTGHGDIETATKCIEAGAADYFEKPIQDWPRFQQVLRRAAAFSRLRLETEQLRDESGEGLLLGNSREMIDVRRQVRQVARSLAPVLIRGESGTGKELVARTLHRLSARTGSFVGVNCGAIPEGLLESELFGYEKGAHSTALQPHDGYFGQADQGTLLLDEIGDMPLTVQVKLLRAIESGQYQPLGARKPRSLTARVIAATHKDLEVEAKAGRFRRDLLFRLDVLRVDVPPLRQRSGDVALLAYRFVHEFNRIEDRSVQRISPEALRLLDASPWPGNVRELRNALRRAVVLATGDEITPDLLPEKIVAEPDPGVALDSGARFDGLLDLPYGRAKAQAVEAFSRAYVEHHLRRAEGVVARAAETAGMQRPNFHRLMTRYGIEPGD